MVDRGLPLSLTLTLERSIDGVGDIKRWHTTSAFLSRRYWQENLIKNSKVRMDAVSHLLEDSQLRDEPVSGETDDPLDWRSSFIFIIYHW